MSKILIVGGAGFIGFSLATELSKNKKNKITLLDNLSRGKADHDFIKLTKKKNIKFIKKNLLNNININEYNFDYIFQFAAIVGVKNVYNDPFAVLKYNVKIHLNVINFAKKQKNLKKFIFSSTSEVFIGTLEKKKT